MSVQSEITRIAGAKSDIADAIEYKGVTVPSSTKIDGMATLIRQIVAGEGVDVSDTTATVNDVAIGKYFYTADGTKHQGLFVGSGNAIYATETQDQGGGTVLTVNAVDISSDTVTAAALLSGYTAHDAAGNAITGSAVAPTAMTDQEIHSAVNTGWYGNQN